MHKPQRRLYTPHLCTTSKICLKITQKQKGNSIQIKRSAILSRVLGRLTDLLFARHKTTLSDSLRYFYRNTGSTAPRDTLRRQSFPQHNFHLLHLKLFLVLFFFQVFTLLLSLRRFLLSIKVKSRVLISLQHPSSPPHQVVKNVLASSISRKK